MPDTAPATTLDPRYGDEGAEPTPWAEARSRMAEAELLWFVSTRPGGGPHATPLLSVWHDGAPHICTGPGEQKAANLAADPRCALLAATDRQEGLDVVLEGVAERVTDPGTLATLAELWAEKYGETWRFAVADGAFSHDGGVAHVFRIRPVRGYGFGKGEVFSQTRWRFSG